jgi:hypothetical protein
MNVLDCKNGSGFTKYARHAPRDFIVSDCFATFPPLLHPFQGILGMCPKMFFLPQKCLTGKIQDIIPV